MNECISRDEAVTRNPLIHAAMEQKPFFGLSEYMYMDKAHAMHAKSHEAQKVHSGFSIDEIMKR